jgi:hypothetical protein
VRPLGSAYGVVENPLNNSYEDWQTTSYSLVVGVGGVGGVRVVDFVVGCVFVTFLVVAVAIKIQ